MNHEWKWSASLLSAILVMAMATPAVLAKSADAKSIEDAITKMEKESAKASVEGQAGEWMKSHQASDYTMGTSWGAWETNSELQKQAGNPAKNKTNKRDISDIKVNVYGDHTAIARYKDSYDIMVEGEHRIRTVLTTDTWVNEKGAWKMVASHSSQANQKIGD